jgi:hypothetical protein
MLLQAVQLSARQLLAEQQCQYQIAHGSLVQVKKDLPSAGTNPSNDTNSAAIFIRLSQDYITSDQ